jgi:hypothetical protein
MSKQDIMPEAIASVTYTLETPNGYNILFTVRGDSGATLLEAMKQTIEPALVKEGYKPQIKSFGTPKVAKPIEYSDKPCPTCGKRLVKGMTKENKAFLKCETQSYDFKTKQRTGCPYFEWL